MTQRHSPAGDDGRAVNILSGYGMALKIVVIWISPGDVHRSEQFLNGRKALTHEVDHE